MNPRTMKNPAPGAATTKRCLRPSTQSLLLYLGVVALALGGAAISISSDVDAEASGAALSPIYGVVLPKGYRQWRFIAPATEAPPLDELRAVLGNDKAVAAYRQATEPFPDGTVLVKLAWGQVPSAEFGPAAVPGAATTVQVMVKDSKRYAATGGWGFGRFIDGKPADLAQHQTCFACHAARVQSRDYVFTRYAP